MLTYAFGEREYTRSSKVRGKRITPKVQSTKEVKC